MNTQSIPVYKDKSLDQLHKELDSTRQRLFLANEHIKNLSEGAQKVSLSIDGAMLELTALLKQLFLCAQHELPEYDMLHAALAKDLNNIAIIAKTHFGRYKDEAAPKNKETKQ